MKKIEFTAAFTADLTKLFDYYLKIINFLRASKIFIRIAIRVIIRNKDIIKTNIIGPTIILLIMITKLPMIMDIHQ